MRPRLIVSSTLLLVEASLCLLQFDKSLIPSTFELVGHEAIVRIDSVKLLAGSIGLVLRRLDLQPQGLEQVMPPLDFRARSVGRGFHRARLHDAENLMSHDLVDGRASK